MPTPCRTEVLFVNHSSLLIKFGEEYLLTDPWYERPAFGSWLPIPPMFVHPANLAALRGKLRILVSHAHDDHCDEPLLRLFDKTTEIITAKFGSGSTERRLRKAGFSNIHAIGAAGKQVGSFTVYSFVNEKVSLDDSLYLIETPDSVIVHCNDMWFPLEESAKAAINKAVSEKGGDRTLYASQTNSASGFPTTYRCYSAEERAKLLSDKVQKMIRTGMKNASEVGAKNFLSYAGFSGIFIEGKANYLAEAIFPDKDYITANLGSEIPAGLEVLDLRPGDSFDFRAVKKSFFGNDIEAKELKRAAIDYYHAYGAVKDCDSYRPGEESLGKEELSKGLDRFLMQFNDFVMTYSKRTNFEPTVVGKVFSITVEDLGLTKSLRFGQGLVDDHNAWNKRMTVSAKLMSMVVQKKILLEDLYTGFNAEFERNPPSVYNRDIVMYLVMFSYSYMNRE